MKAGLFQGHIAQGVELLFQIGNLVPVLPDLLGGPEFLYEKVGYGNKGPNGKGNQDQQIKGYFFAYKFSSHQIQAQGKRLGKDFGILNEKEHGKEKNGHKHKDLYEAHSPSLKEIVKKPGPGTKIQPLST